MYQPGPDCVNLLLAGPGSIGAEPERIDTDVGTA